jgi:hypothetical protein
MAGALPRWRALLCRAATATVACVASLCALNQPLGRVRVSVLSAPVPFASPVTSLLAASASMERRQTTVVAGSCVVAVNSPDLPFSCVREAEREV